MKTAGRLIISQPMTGSGNMSLDQAILESTQLSGTPALRFYRWSPATLSLGYFQKAADRNRHSASQNCPIVRRASGGGAILHDDELTYSLCVATAGMIARANTALFDTVHESIQKALAAQDVSVTLYPQPTAATVDDPFLCFQRRSKGDIICGTDKVGGSAQRRLKNALIQHGSLLLSQSQFAPELPGLAELSDSDIDVDALIVDLTSQLAQATGIDFLSSQPTSDELERANEIAQAKFSSENWLHKR